MKKNQAGIYRRLQLQRQNIDQRNRCYRLLLLEGNIRRENMQRMLVSQRLKIGLLGI